MKYRFQSPANLISILVYWIVPIAGDRLWEILLRSEKVFSAMRPICIANLFLLISIFGILIASPGHGCADLSRFASIRLGTFLFSYPSPNSPISMGRFWGSFVTLMFICGKHSGFYWRTFLVRFSRTDELRTGQIYWSITSIPGRLYCFPNLWLQVRLLCADCFHWNIQIDITPAVSLFILSILLAFPIS